MGEVKVKVELENYGRSRAARDEVYALRTVDSGRERVDVIVDSGAMMLVLPQDLVEALGLATLRKAIVTYADERKEERNIAGVVAVKVAGREVETSCVVGPPGSEPLLGQIVLEEADLLIDCANQQLIPCPESPSTCRH